MFTGWHVGYRTNDCDWDENGTLDAWTCRDKIRNASIKEKIEAANIEHKMMK